jgi:Ca-activated chloride channel homolog
MIDRLLTLHFGQPWWLALLVLVPLLAWLQGRPGRSLAVRFSGMETLRKIGAVPQTARGHLISQWTLLPLFLLIVAMACPRIQGGDSKDKKEGIDIVFCVDVSGSMDEKDFDYKGNKISRREALVMAIDEFVDARPNDRFGMVGFAGHTYLMSPLTLDGEWIKNVLKNIRTQGGTAIGDGIVASVDLLKKGAGKSKVMVVVTDGENNAGLAPVKAAEIAKEQNIRVHTVRISRLREVTADGAVKSLLGQVAEKTGGLYFQAANLESIIDVYRQIDRMEKSKFQQKQYRVYDELYPWLVCPAFVLFLFGFVGNNTRWMRIP